MKQKHFHYLLPLTALIVKKQHKTKQQLLNLNSYKIYFIKFPYSKLLIKKNK